MANRYYDKPAKFRVSDAYGDVTLQIDISTLSEATFLTEEYAGYKVFNDVSVYTDETKTELKYPIGWYEVTKVVNPSYDPADPDSPEFIYKWLPSQTDGQTIEFSNIDDEGVRAKYLNETYQGYRVIQLVTMRDSGGAILRAKGWYECHDIADYEADPDADPIWEWIPAESESGAIEQADAIMKFTTEPRLDTLGKIAYLYAEDNSEVFTQECTPGLYVLAPRDATHALPYWKKVELGTPDMETFKTKLLEGYDEVPVVVDIFDKDRSKIKIDGVTPTSDALWNKYPRIEGWTNSEQQPLPSGTAKPDRPYQKVKIIDGGNFSSWNGTTSSERLYYYFWNPGNYVSEDLRYAVTLFTLGESQITGDWGGYGRYATTVPAFSSLIYLFEFVQAQTSYRYTVTGTHAVPYCCFKPGLWFTGACNFVPDSVYWKRPEGTFDWTGNAHYNIESWFTSSCPYRVKDLNVLGKRLPDNKVGQYIVLDETCTITYGYDENPGFYSVEEIPLDDPTAERLFEFKEKSVFSTAKDITDIATLYTGVEGCVHRYGNMITFTFKGNNTGYIRDIASGLPRAFNNAELYFVASTSNDESTASAPCTLRNGMLKFNDTDGFQSFVVSGTYYSDEYENHIGVIQDTLPMIKKLGFLPEPTEDYADEVYMYTGNTYIDPVLGKVVKGSLWSVIYDEVALVYKWVSHSANYEQNPNPEIVKTEGVEGECYRDGSMISFWFSYTSDTPVSTIATKLPCPMNAYQPKFSAITSYDGASTSAVVELSDVGELMFSGDEEYKSFTVSGSYKCRDYVGASLVTAPWQYEKPIYVTQQEWAALPDDQKVDGHYVITRKVGESLGFSRPTWHKSAWLVDRFYNATKDVWKNTTGQDVYVVFAMSDLRNSSANNIIVERKVYDASGVVVGSSIGAADLSWYNRGPMIFWVPSGGKITATAQSNVWWDDPAKGVPYYTTDNLDLPINLVLGR